MGVVSGIVVYFLTFWTVLFAVLPWGNRAPDTPETGMATSAPEKPRIGRKVLITAGISALIWLAIFGVMKSGIIDFYDDAYRMMAEDRQPHETP